MAKVSLRGYTREIEGMVDGGQVDEAIAHCLHILKTFPMHIETYRLLGKAFLETRRYADAADIFQRVLMAVPDDFVSHVGMSIIRDDENKLDESIWHMERAYQMQPSNLAIQSELRRLYGRREGVEPPKIRLSRDALANMYCQGELYNQAIAEIRAILAEDPNRPDLQIMLARAYFKAGQKVEATELCAGLLKKYPNCMDALRIMSEILPGTGRAENTQVYRGRVRSLDPYSAFVTGSVFQSDQVADAAINLERLDYHPGIQPGASQPSWAASLGIKLEGEAPKESTQPEWLSAAPEQPIEQPISFAPSSEGTTAEEPLTGKEDIPDWMRSAGWNETTGEAKEGAVDFGSEGAEEPISKADIPEWLKAIAPAGALGAVVAEPGATLSSDKEASDTIGKPPAGEVVPESLDESETIPETTPTTVEPSPKLEEIVDKGLEPAEGMPDWLKDLSIPTEDNMLTQEIPTPTIESPKAEEPSTPSISTEEHPVEAGAGSVLDGSDALAWLEALAAKQGARADELITNPESRPEGTPEWVDKLAGETVEPTPEAPVTPIEEPIAEVPITPTESVAEGPKIPVEEPVIPVIEIPTVESTVPPKEPVEDETITTWLKTLDETGEEGEVLKAPSVESGTQPAEELPDWLRGLEKPHPTEAAPTAEELPEWLRGEAAPAPTATEGALTEAGVPEWVAEEPAPEALKPVTPEEWVPEAVEAETAPPAVAETPSALPAVEKSDEVPQPVEHDLVAAGTLSPIPVQVSKETELLSGAQATLDAGQLNQSMQEYAKIIRKGKLLEEVIHDLREITYRYPVDVIVWQTLGDAYMRANQLQEALDAYTKAEELLR